MKIDLRDQPTNADVMDMLVLIAQEISRLRYYSRITPNNTQGMGIGPAAQVVRETPIPVDPVTSIPDREAVLKAHADDPTPR